MIRLFFGSPGAGKTTLAQKLLLESKHDHKLANHDTVLADKFNAQQIGKFDYPRNTYLSIDEASIEFNSRRFKDFTDDKIEYFKTHRKRGVDIDLFSQSHDDVDITLRRLCDELWHIRKLGPITRVRKIKKYVDIDKNTHQIIDAYRFAGIFWSFLPPPFHERTVYFIRRSKYYKYFDTTECRKLPKYPYQVNFRPKKSFINTVRYRMLPYLKNRLKRKNKNISENSTDSTQ